ncbi:MAG: uracil-DNA glycosylase family protein, partial [Bacteroidia bacterium]|nr:uracil-DNA glycosylase family protein [Bacteroidia bacterium]
MYQPAPLLFQQIASDPEPATFRAQGWPPVYTASRQSRIVLVGQAPGRIAQQTRKPWNDASGRLLRQWLGVSDEQFYSPELFALMPMDFYYPGKGAHGDLPPRKGFAAKWHPKLLALMPNVRLVIPVGSYAA